MKVALMGILVALCSLAAGCLKIWEDDAGCACTTEYRHNICVFWDDSDTLPRNLTFLRERDDGARDTLKEDQLCFGELREPQRILVLQDTNRVDSSEWFTPPTVDCCHGMATNVNFQK